MRKIFLSFTTLLTLLAKDKVSFEDLRHGLFFFGCTRRHAYEPGAQGEADERQWNHGRNAAGHPTLVQALRQAEMDGRAEWQSSDDRPQRDPWESLDELLERNGHKATGRGPGHSWDAGYPAIADALTRRGVDVQPVY